MSDPESLARSAFTVSHELSPRHSAQTQRDCRRKPDCFLQACLVSPDSSDRGRNLLRKGPTQFGSRCVLPWRYFEPEMDTDSRWSRGQLAGRLELRRQRASRDDVVQMSVNLCNCHLRVLKRSHFQLTTPGSAFTGSAITASHRKPSAETERILWKGFCFTRYRAHLLSINHLGNERTKME